MKIQRQVKSSRLWKAIFEWFMSWPCLIVCLLFKKIQRKVQGDEKAFLKRFMSWPCLIVCLFFKKIQRKVKSSRLWKSILERFMSWPCTARPGWNRAAHGNFHGPWNFPGAMKISMGPGNFQDLEISMGHGIFHGDLSITAMEISRSWKFPGVLRTCKRSSIPVDFFYYISFPTSPQKLIKAW